MVRLASLLRTHEGTLTETSELVSFVPDLSTWQLAQTELRSNSTPFTRVCLVSFLTSSDIL